MLKPKPSSQAPETGTETGKEAAPQASPAAAQVPPLAAAVGQLSSETPTAAHRIWRKLREAVVTAGKTEADPQPEPKERTSAMLASPEKIENVSEAAGSEAASVSTPDTPMAKLLEGTSSADAALAALQKKIQSEKEAAPKAAAAKPAEKPEGEKQAKLRNRQADQEAFARIKAKAAEKDSNVIDIKATAARPADEKQKLIISPEMEAEALPQSTLEALHSHISTLRYQLTKIETAAAADRQRVNDLTDQILKLSNHILDSRRRSWWQAFSG